MECPANNKDPNASASPIAQSIDGESDSSIFDLFDNKSTILGLAVNPAGIWDILSTISLRIVVDTSVLTGAKISIPSLTLYGLIPAAVRSANAAFKEVFTSKAINSNSSDVNTFSSINRIL